MALVWSCAPDDLAARKRLYALSWRAGADARTIAAQQDAIGKECAAVVQFAVSKRHEQLKTDRKPALDGSKRRQVVAAVNEAANQLCPSMRTRGVAPDRFVAACTWVAEGILEAYAWNKREPRIDRDGLAREIKDYIRRCYAASAHRGYADLRPSAVALGLLESDDVARRVFEDLFVLEDFPQGLVLAPCALAACARQFRERVDTLTTERLSTKSHGTWHVIAYPPVVCITTTWPAEFPEFNNRIREVQTAIKLDLDHCLCALGEFNRRGFTGRIYYWCRTARAALTAMQEGSAKAGALELSTIVAPRLCTPEEIHAWRRYDAPTYKNKHWTKRLMAKEREADAPTFQTARLFQAGVPRARHSDDDS